MIVNNSKVHDYIQEALDKQSQGSFSYRLDRAFADVNYQRNSQCENLNLTAADHYLISRYLIVKLSPVVATIYIEMIVGYDGVYKGVNEIVKKFGGSNLVFRTGNCQPSEFSPLVMAWAFTGVSDGIVDCKGPMWQESAKIYAPRFPAGYFHRLAWL